MRDEQLEELLGVYALDALDDGEKETVEKHLAANPRWRAEVDAHRETIGFVVHATLAADGSAPPDHVWEGIRARLEEAPPPLRLVAAPRTQSRWIGAVSAFAAAAAAAVVLLGVLVVRQGNRLDEMTIALEGDRLASAAAEAVAAPGSQVVTLVDPGGTPLEVLIAIGPDGVGYLVSDSLPALPADRAYQLWAIVDGNVLSAGLLGPDPGVSPFVVTGDIQGLAITEEVAGGVVTSEADPVALWLRDT